MGWEAELEELRRREALAEQMGGPDKVARQHGRGKMDARARLAALVDTGSFREIGKIAGRGSYGPDGELDDLAASNFIFGRANIDGRPVVASADDFTVRGGAADAALHRKFVQCEAMAHEYRLPLIRMIDGTGGGGSVKTLEDMGYTYIPHVPGWHEIIANLDTVPVVALALGPTAGLFSAGASLARAGGAPSPFRRPRRPWLSWRVTSPSRAVHCCTFAFELSSSSTEPAPSKPISTATSANQKRGRRGAGACCE